MKRLWILLLFALLLILAACARNSDENAVHGTQQGTATLTQDLTLLKTPRGRRISGGDPWRHNNVVGTLP